MLGKWICQRRSLKKTRTNRWAWGTKDEEAHYAFGTRKEMGDTPRHRFREFPSSPPPVLLPNFPPFFGVTVIHWR